MYIICIASAWLDTTCYLVKQNSDLVYLRDPNVVTMTLAPCQVSKKCIGQTDIDITIAILCMLAHMAYYILQGGGLLWGQLQIYKSCRSLAMYPIVPQTTPSFMVKAETVLGCYLDIVRLAIED